MRSWSISDRTLFGVDVRLHLTFLILPHFVFWTDYAAHRQSANGGRAIWRWSAIILACVAAHECGHMLVARRVGADSESGDSSAADRRCTLRRVARPRTAAYRLIVAAGDPSGPGWASGQPGAGCRSRMPSLLAAVRGSIDLWKWPLLQAANLPRSVVWANLYLAVLNLMPAYPLDGGRILRAYFSRTLDPASATRRAVSISNAIAMVLMLPGLFSDTWLTMVGVIVFSAAQLEERALVFQSVLDNVRLEEVMLTDFATLSPADTLEDALEKAVHSLQDDFPVVRGSDMVGVISKQRILDALRAEGNGYVQAVMNKIFEVSVRQDSLGLGLPQAHRAKFQHHSRRRRPAPDRHRDPAEPDALHVAAGRKPQAAAG